MIEEIVSQTAGWAAAEDAIELSEPVSSWPINQQMLSAVCQAVWPAVRSVRPEWWVEG